MALINWKVELKLRWARHCVLANAGVKNDDADSNNIITVKYYYYQRHRIYVPVVTLSTKGNLKLSKLLSKGFKRSVYWNEYKTKREDKNMTNVYGYRFKSKFVWVNRLFVLINLNKDKDLKRF